MFSAIKERALDPLALGYIAVLAVCALLLALPLANF